MPKVVFSDVAPDGRTSVPADVIEALRLDARGGLAWIIADGRIEVASIDVPCLVPTIRDFWEGIARALEDMYLGRLARADELEWCRGWGRTVARTAVCVTQSFRDDAALVLGFYVHRIGTAPPAGWNERLDALCRLVGIEPHQGVRLTGRNLRWRRVGSFVAIYHVDDDEKVATLLRLYNKASKGCAEILET